MNNWQKAIQDLLDQAVESGSERGLQVAAYHRGELVVDAFAGSADAATGEPVTAETLFPVFSTTKGMMATIIHRLAERGELDYDTPIAALWPEFGAHGKGGITISNALDHTAGLPYIPLSVNLSNVYDWDFVCAALAASQPASAPGERAEYHAITYGWLLGEVARRASGRSMSDLWREELCAPLGVENSLFCGIPAGLQTPIAVLEDPNFGPGPSDDPQPEAIPSWIWPLGDWMNTTEARSACLPASNGIMNARAIARHYASLLPGGVDGIELLPPSRVQIACSYDPTPNAERPHSLGYSVANPEWLGSLDTFGHNGHGGSIGMADPQSGLAFGFARNRFYESEASRQVLEVLRNMPFSP